MLVVDDEPAILAVMKVFLSDHDVTVANDGREAIALIDANDFDVVFCDLIMPKLTGMDVYEHMQGRGSGGESRIVFMSGGAFTERARVFLESVKNRVLEKPFTQRDVDAVLAERAGWESQPR